MIKNLKKRLKDQRGLTLVELLAVIVILGIISAIAVPSIGGIIQKAEEDALKADAIQVINAAKTHVASNGIPKVALTESDLDAYIDSVGLETGYTVAVSTDGTSTTFALTGVGKVGDSTTITFTGATIESIDGDDKKGTRTITSSGTVMPAK